MTLFTHIIYFTNMTSILLTGNNKQKCKVSSTLNKSIEFSSKNMFDNDINTCWNSDQGSPQSILIDFQRLVKIQFINITFQGGFVGQECEVKCGLSNNLLELIEIIYPEDVNDQQTFQLPETETKYLSIIFPSSTDFYGRITIYSLEVFGEEISENT